MLAAGATERIRHVERLRGLGKGDLGLCLLLLLHGFLGI